MNPTHPVLAAGRCTHSVIATTVVALLLTLSVSCGRNDVDTGQAAPTAVATGGATAPPPTRALPLGSTTPATAAPTTLPPPSSTSVTTVATTLSPPPAASVPAVPSAAPGAPHPTTTTSLRLVDTTRPTVSRGRTLSSSRSLPTTVYYPTDGGSYPLIVFAHGFEIGPGPYSRICQAMAAAGYVVAAPSFPLTDRNAAGGNLDRGDLGNQAGDVGFVISSVGSAGAPLAGKVDATKVGVVGHSDGADTALDVGYVPLRVDNRVRAIVAFAPDAMTGPGGSVGTAPLLLEQGDRDSVVPYSNSTTVFGQVKTHRFFLTLLGADHLPPVQGASPWAAVHEQVLIDFLDRYVAGRTADDAAIVAHGNHPGVSAIKTAG